MPLLIVWSGDANMAPPSLLRWLGFQQLPQWWRRSANEPNPSDHANNRNGSGHKRKCNAMLRDSRRRVAEQLSNPAAHCSALSFTASPLLISPLLRRQSRLPTVNKCLRHTDKSLVPYMFLRAEARFQTFEFLRKGPQPNPNAASAHFTYDPPPSLQRRKKNESNSRRTTAK